MKYLLITAPNLGDSMEVGIPNGRRMSRMFGGTPLSWERAPDVQLRNANLVAVDEVDLETAVAHLSELHAGKEILVLEAEKIYQRAPGPLVEKKLGKEGILPG
jgi:hypothetical protein